MKCIEPDYKTLLDPKLIRRMSRIIRMGVAAALACLQEAGVKEPDAIVTGTAYGCIEDTSLFRPASSKERRNAPARYLYSIHT